MGGALLVVLCALAAAMSAPGSARADSGLRGFVYWANHDTNTIGRANLDATMVNQAFITGVTGPTALTLAYSSVSSNTYLLWANPAENAIGRVKYDGSANNPHFITGASNPSGVATAQVEDPYPATTSHFYVYWTNRDTGTIGRANLDDGTGVNQSFISGASQPTGLVAGNGFLYWTNSATNTIGRAKLDRSEINQSYISGVTAASALDFSFDARFFWTDPSHNTIGTVKGEPSPGAGLNASLIAGTSNPQGVATVSVGATTVYPTNRAFVFWSNAATNTIGRANQDGTDVNQSYITGASSPRGVIVNTFLDCRISLGTCGPGSPLPTGDSPTRPRPVPCAGLRRLALSRCRARLAHDRALARCRRLKAKKRARCVKRANRRYKRTLARLKCRSITNPHKQKACQRRARKIRN